ncbi:hypothetical protein KIF24_00985 [Micromonospora sp. Llam7]|nr:hypothetical protein [Micromonospora tarapacensis]MBX7264766.1 hypothetical protein [Micromonospora tarapacensis]
MVRRLPPADDRGEPIRHRPTVRDVVAQVARDQDAPATIVQFALGIRLV